jgi:hypothetical protein
MAITQNRNGANHNSGHGANDNGHTGSNGGHGEDAPKAGNGENGGTNTIGCGGGCPTCGG